MPRIYVKDRNGSLQPMSQAPFDSENLLQRLLAEHPEILAGNAGDDLRAVPERARPGFRSMPALLEDR